MFIKDMNGFLVNVFMINKINIQINEAFCMVVAHLKDETIQTIYKSTELQLAQDYLENLSRKIAVNYEVWEV